MKGNVIPRNAKKIRVTVKKDEGSYKKGEEFIIQKNDRNMWSDGRYSYFVEHLRNPELCSLEVLEREGN